MDNLGIILVIALLGGGLVWLLIRAFRGREVERRVIFLFIFLAVAAPTLLTMTFKMHATPIVRALYDKIESMPEGSGITSRASGLLICLKRMAVDLTLPQR